MHTPSSFTSGSSLSPRYSIELADFPETLTCNLLISSARLVPQNLAQDTKQLSSTINDSILNHKTSMVRCIAIVDHPIYFPPSTLLDTSRDYSQPRTAEGEAEPSTSIPQGPEIPLPAPHPLDTGLLVFPPSSVPDGSTTTAATVLVTGEGSMSTPAGKCLLSSFFATILIN
jgi:Rab proteins geranylgeranyltransferase component A